MITVRNTSDGQISERIKLNIDLSNRQTVIGKFNSTTTYVYPILENVEIEPKLIPQTFKSEEYGYDVITVKKIPTEDLSIVPEEEKQNFEGIFNKIDIDAIDYIETEDFEVSEINFSNVKTRQIEVGVTLPAKSAKYMKNVKIAKDENLISANIRQDTTVYGIKGSPTVSETSDATATADKLLEGETAYVKGRKVEGTIKEYDGSYSGSGIIV